MKTTNAPIRVEAPLAEPSQTMTAHELAEIVESFNDLTSKLHASHEQLKSEVVRLSGELSKASGELERSRRLAALGEMAAGIAHEVRNPLGSIRLYARMLVEDLANQPEQKKLSEKIVTAARGLESIVGDVLTFSKEFKIRHAQVDARDLFESCLEACKHDGVVGHDTVKATLPPQGTMFMGDASLLKQALVNVIRNAYEAMNDANGPHALKLTATLNAGVLSLGVTDSGPGIKPEVVARMFNPFFTTRAAGTGLGLPIVHRIAEAHGGRVEVRNNSEISGAGSRGATIAIIMPANPAESSE